MAMPLAFSLHCNAHRASVNLCCLYTDREPKRLQLQFTLVREFTLLLDLRFISQRVNAAKHASYCAQPQYAGVEVWLNSMK